MEQSYFTISNISFLKLYKFKCPEDILLETFENVKLLNFDKNCGNYMSNLRINNLKKFEKINQWFQLSIDSVFHDLKLPETFKRIKLTESWANKTDKGEFHHEHHHAHSYLSGVLYLNNNYSCRTFFKSKNLWYSDDFLFEIHKQRGTENFSEYNFFEEKTVAGNLLIFPSKLKHFVNENEEDNNPRYTIAFNAYPEICDDSFASHIDLRVFPYGTQE